VGGKQEPDECHNAWPAEKEIKSRRAVGSTRLYRPLDVVQQR
jgi:hypothetical protein